MGRFLIINFNPKFNLNIITCLKISLETFIQKPEKLLNLLVDLTNSYSPG
ncbi:hypothetical protein GFO_0732 [Christiangramia forsetii KT0803]|uniref:Uncharacterized protein n=1 Tax=Christiangramia forsetii (strain DSM 17595 / CGMCC 1.15422 / KT0803) TaxID=411154 RepID=A0LZB4_CHRFK|nr:hypothetical protein GFO_0732 [Christiangramia forsetii KT0803]